MKLGRLQVLKPRSARLVHLGATTPRATRSKHSPTLQKGFISKIEKMIAFPLTHTKTVEGKEKVTITYEFPQEGKEKPMRFDFIFEVDEAEKWDKAISEIIPGQVKD